MDVSPVYKECLFDPVSHFPLYFYELYRKNVNGFLMRSHTVTVNHIHLSCNNFVSEDDIHECYHPLKDYTLQIKYMYGYYII